MKQNHPSEHRTPDPRKSYLLQVSQPLPQNPLSSTPEAQSIEPVTGIEDEEVKQKGVPEGVPEPDQAESDPVGEIEPADEKQQAVRRTIHRILAQGSLRSDWESSEYSQLSDGTEEAQVSSSPPPVKPASPVSEKPSVLLPGILLEDSETDAEPLQAQESDTLEEVLDRPYLPLNHSDALNLLGPLAISNPELARNIDQLFQQVEARQTEEESAYRKQVSLYRETVRHELRTIAGEAQSPKPVHRIPSEREPLPFVQVNRVQPNPPVEAAPKEQTDLQAEGQSCFNNDFADSQSTDPADALPSNEEPPLPSIQLDSTETDPEIKSERQLESNPLQSNVQGADESADLPRAGEESPSPSDLPSTEDIPNVETGAETVSNPTPDLDLELSSTVSTQSEEEGPSLDLETADSAETTSEPEPTPESEPASEQDPASNQQTQHEVAEVQARARARARKSWFHLQRSLPSQETRHILRTQFHQSAKRFGENLARLSTQIQLRRIAKQELRTSAGRLYASSLPFAALLFIISTLLHSNLANRIEPMVLLYTLSNLLLPILALLLPLLLLLKRHPIEPKYLMGSAQTSPAAKLFSGLVAIPFLLASTGLTSLVTYLLQILHLNPSSGTWITGPTVLTTPSLHGVAPIVFLLYCIFEPILEELFFRGLLQGFFLDSGHVRVAIFTQALAYALYRPDPLFWCAPFVLGLFLGILRSVMRDLRCSMLAHVLYRIGMFVLFLAFPQLQNLQYLVGTQSGSVLIQISLALLATGLMILIPSIALIRGFSPKSLKRKFPTSSAGEHASGEGYWPFEWLFALTAFAYFVLKWVL